MGHWGAHPWQNDSALDWLDEFAAQSRFTELIEAGLNLPLEQIDEIRAATHLLLQFAGSEVSVVPETTRLLALARQRLNNALDSGLFTTRQFRLRVLGEVDALSAAALKQSVTGRDDDDAAEAISRIATEVFGLTQYDLVDVEGHVVAARDRDIVGTGFLDADGVLHLQLEDGRPNGFQLKCRCVPDVSGQSS